MYVHLKKFVREGFINLEQLYATAGSWSQYE
jgi:hypothetical protein